MKIITRIYALVLLCYTSWRTVDFLLSQLPKNDWSFWISIAFLFCTEIGLIVWHTQHLKHTTTHEQEQIASTMTVIDFVGSFIAGVADMILRQTMLDNYQIPFALVQVLIYGLPTIMALNVASVILYELADAETQMRRAEKAVEFEIHREAIKAIEREKKALAGEKKSQVYQTLKNNIVGKVDKEYAPEITVISEKEKEKQLPAKVPTRRTRKNLPER